MERTAARRATGAVLAVLVLQAVLLGARGYRDPSPIRTFHRFDVTLAQTVKVMRGEAWAMDLPVQQLVPNTWYGQGPPQMWSAVPGNTEDGQKLYKKQQPLYFLLAGALPALLGLAPATLRLGPWMLLGAMAGLMGWTARRLAGPRALLAAALLILLVPAGWQTAMMSLPGLGLMLGASLVMAGVVASDWLRKPAGAVATGLAVAITAWMGESAGDAVQGLAVVVPVVVTGGMVGVGRRGTVGLRLRALMGIAIALGVAWACVDVAWLQKHTRGYLLSEATGGGRPPDLLTFLSTAPVGLLQNLVYGYGETLAWSLLAPVGAVVVGVGLAAGIWSQRRVEVLWALSGPLALLILLSMPEKASDYYALAAVPGLVLAAGLGLTALGRVGLALVGVGGTGLLVMMCTVIHLDTPPVKAAICTPEGSVWLLQDSLACAGTKPERQIRPTLRIARGLPGSPETRRMAVSQWLLGYQMESIWDRMAPGSVIWVVGGPRSPTDAALVVALTQRSDLIVRSLPVEANYWQARPALVGTEEWVFLMGQMGSGTATPPRWPSYLSRIEDFGGTGDIRVGRLPSR